MILSGHHREFRRFAAWDASLAGFKRGTSHLIRVHGEQIIDGERKPLLYHYCAVPEVRRINPEEKQRNRRKITENTEGDLD